MPLEVYQPAAFDYPHEREMFAQLEASLRTQIGASPDLYLLIGNYHVSARNLDALFVGPGIATVIEMKGHGGRVLFAENEPWRVNDVEIKQSAAGNPYRQAASYRFLLWEYLKGRSAEYRARKWGRIGAMVLFGRPITLINSLPKETTPWFQVADMTNGAARLLARRDREILQSREEIEHFKRCLAPGQQRDGNATTAPITTAVVFSVLRQSDFPESMIHLRKSGMELGTAARIIEERFTWLKKLPTQNPFSDLPFRIPKEIASAIVYAINSAAELVCLKEGHHKFFPLFAGSTAAVAAWLERNTGTVLTLEGSEHRLTLSLATTTAKPPPRLPAAVPETVPEPYLARLAGPELEAVMPAGLIKRELEKIDATSSDQHVEDVLVSLSDDTAALFRDLFRLLRAGDVPGAKARLGLRLGSTIIATDAPAALDEAVGSASNSDQIVILNDLTPEQMKEILNLDRFKEWMYYLHPDQKRYVEDDYEKPVVLTGVSGSGKTCILVHRVRHLARKYPNERIGLFTLNRNLAGLLKELVKDLLTPEEGKNVHVCAFYDYFSELLHELGAEAYLDQLARVAGHDSPLERAIEQHVDPKKLAREVDTQSQETIEDTWDNFLDSGDDDFRDTYRPIGNLLSRERVNAHRYLREEFTLIRSMWSPEARGEQYPGFDRSDFSRVIAFPQDIRYYMLKLLLRYEEFMLEGGMLDVLSLTHALLPLRQQIRELPPEKRFRFVLIDEFQDFSNLDLVILREVCTHAATDGMFLAGDLVQKILVKKLVLREAGFDSTASRWLKIRRNFRNSRQILAAAFELAKTYGEIARSKREEIEVLDPELAVRETAKPFALQTDHPVDKAWEIAARMVGQEKRAPWTICIATANPSVISTDTLMKRRPVALPAQLLSADWLKQRDHVVICEINDLKGFEFHLVLIVGLDRQQFPETGVPEEERWRDALRLYVAMTRARDELHLLYREEPSVYLDAMRPHLEWRQEKYGGGLGRRIGDETVAPSVPKEDKTWIVNREPSCLDWFSPMQVRLLRDYFLIRVHGVKNLPPHDSKERMLLENSKRELFKQWLTPKSLGRVSYKALVAIDPPKHVLVEEIRAILKAHGHDLAPANAHPVMSGNGRPAAPAKPNEGSMTLKQLRERHRETGGSGPVIKP